MSIEPIKGMKKGRRTLLDIPRTVSPLEVLRTITEGEGWPYKDKREEYLVRDRALVALLYMGALRISEALRLKRSQFQPSETFPGWIIEGVKLSKERMDKPRRHAYREEIWLPSVGEREALTKMIMDYVEPLPDEPVPLFGFKSNARASEIISSLTGGVWNEATKAFSGGLWNHYFRAQGERYLFRRWKRDLFKTANYLKVDPRTLIKYLESEQIWDLEPV